MTDGRTDRQTDLYLYLYPLGWHTLPSHANAEWPPVCSSIFQVLLKSVQWFCRCEWSKIALPHYFGHWLIQQLVLPYKPWLNGQTLQCHAHATVHWNASTFKLTQAFDHILFPYKFHDDILNGSRIIAMTNKHTHKQTLLRICHFHCTVTAQVVNTHVSWLFLSSLQ